MGRGVGLGMLAAAAALAVSATGAHGASPAPVAPTPIGGLTDPALNAMGAEGCTIAALSSNDTAAFTIPIGPTATSSITDAYTASGKTPYEVDLSQGFGAGVNIVLGITKPPILASADFSASLVYDSTSAYDVATPAESNRIIAFGEDPTTLDAGLAKLLANSWSSSLSAGDGSIGLSASGFDDALEGDAGLGVSAGWEHMPGGYSEVITTLSANANVDLTLGLPLSVGGDIAVTQTVLVGKDGQLDGIRLELSFDDNGAVVLEGTKESGGKGEGEGGKTPAQGGAAPKEGEGPVDDAVSSFDLKAGSVGIGDIADVAGTLALDTDPALRARVLGDLVEELHASTLPSAIRDLIGLIGGDGFVTYDSDHVHTDESGISFQAGIGPATFTLDFSADNEETALQRAFQVTPSGALVRWTQCDDAANFRLPIVKAGGIPGLGATYKNWLTVQKPDPSGNSTNANQPCAAAAPPTCFGGLNEGYDAGGPFGDVYRLVDPAQDTYCPIPFVKSSLTAELQSCRVGAMLVQFPWPVPQSTAVTIAHTLLPKDAHVVYPSGIGPVPTQTDSLCQGWASATFGGLRTLDDPGGSFYLAFISGLPEFGQGLSGLIGAAGEAESYESDVVNSIALFLPNQGQTPELC